uniref:PiggyBac transposable element-derived protein domain-containing protein n=1 Tax=Romanomermis culicivorax TaxID=13658 RepID=A0A915KEV5_ROMCU
MATFSDVVALSTDWDNINTDIFGATSKHKLCGNRKDLMDFSALSFDIISFLLKVNGARMVPTSIKTVFKYFTFRAVRFPFAFAVFLTFDINHLERRAKGPGAPLADAKHRKTLTGILQYFRARMKMILFSSANGEHFKAENQNRLAQSFQKSYLVTNLRILIENALHMIIPQSKIAKPHFGEPLQQKSLNIAHITAI